MSKPGFVFLFALAFSLSVPGYSSAADPELRCSLRDKGKLLAAAQRAIFEREAVVRVGEGEKLAEGSLSPGSFLVSMDDKSGAIPLHAAFVGTGSAAQRSGGNFSLDTLSLQCRDGENMILHSPRSKERYLACFLDIANFEKGELIDTTRLLGSSRQAMDFGRAMELKAEDRDYAYSLSFDRFDPDSGFSLSLLDKQSRKRVSYAGPPQTMRQTVMMALTLGSRDGDGRFIRLACQFTDSLEYLPK